MKHLYCAAIMCAATLSPCLIAAAAEMPSDLYLVGHLPGGVWNSNTCVAGERDGDRFYFRNVSFNHSDNWNQASFGFITRTGINPVNPSDYFYSSQSSGGADVAVTGNSGPYAMYLSSAGNEGRRSGWVLPDKGTYSMTVDFSDADSPQLYMYIKSGNGDSGEENWDNVSDWPDFWLRIGGNGSPAVQFSRKGNEYSADLNSSRLGDIGNWFKISTTDNEWSVNYGIGGPLPDELPCAVNTEFQGMDNNFINKGWGDFTIRFRYNPYDKYDCPVVYFLPQGYTGDLPQVTVTGLSGTLPVLYINVYTGGENDPKTTLDNEIIDPNLRHKNYFYNAEYWLDMNGVDWMEGAENLGSAENPLPLDIKGRGNWTLRGFVKKPYKLKLGKKARMLGLSNSKHFAILAHADDNAGYLRNYVGFNLGKRAGLPWTPSQQPVEVVINGNYRGLYFLTESIRVESDRIDIEELDDNVDDMAYVTGGYVMEFDNYADDAVWSATGGNAVWHDGHNFPVYLTPDTPEAYSAPQQEFVSSQFDRMNSLVGNHNPELWSYLDIDDAVRYYMVEEIISHYEAYHGSTYLFRDRGEARKWHFSPLWDCGHAFEGGTSNFFYESPLSMGNTWICCLKDTPGFESRLKETWLWFMSSAATGLMSDIDTYCGHIAEAAKADRERWKNAGRPQYTDGWEAWEVQDNSDIEARKNQVLSQLNAKLAWLRGQWGDYTAGSWPEPERDTTPAAALDQKYIDALPRDYIWAESFINEIESEHAADGYVILGNLTEQTARENLNLSKTEVTFDSRDHWGENPEPSVSLADNGDVILSTPVPAVYNVTLTMKEHKEGSTTYLKSTIGQKVTVRPTFSEFGITHGTIDFEKGEIELFTGSPWNIRVWSPFGGYEENPGFDELYYRVSYAEGRPESVAAADSADEYPYGMTLYDTAQGLDLNYADGIRMAVKVNGAESRPYDFTFNFAGGGIVTEVLDIPAHNDADARYFDLNGIETRRPEAPGVYIRVVDGNAEKFIVR